MRSKLCFIDIVHLLLHLAQEVKSLKSTIAKIEGAARQRDALLAERTALSEQLQVCS